MKMMRKEAWFIGSYFATHIIVKSHGRYHVRYETLIEENGDPLEEKLIIDKTFPYLLTVIVDLAHGDVVDA